ncbi:MAG: hypothetical protein NVS4B12_28840 [Ktedonobacteraceae bacterium]
MAFWLIMAAHHEQCYIARKEQAKIKVVEYNVTETFIMATESDVAINPVLYLPQ